MPDVTIHLPEEMRDYATDLQYFVNTMVRKLHTNRHKGTSKKLPLSIALKLARAEIKEAKQALKEQGQFEFSVECVDVANFAFLAARSAWDMTRVEFEEERDNG